MIRLNPQDFTFPARAYRIVNSVWPSSAVDVVGIFDSNFQQLFTEARAMKAVIKPNARMMDHPVETGSTLTDNIVYDPLEIELSVIIASDNFKSVYDQIMQAFREATLLTVQTRAGSFKNMLIYSPAHEEDPGMITALSLAIKLREVLYGTTVISTLKPKAPVNQTTVDRGNLNPQPAVEKKSSVAARIFG